MAERDQKAILSWLDKDPAHVEELIRERKIYDTILLSGDRPPDGKRTNFLTAMPRWTKELLRTAAVFAMVLGLGYSVDRVRQHRIGSLSNTVTVPAGQRANITLPDGTNVWLNSLSEITYPMFFTGKERSVKLTGEAFFDVSHDARKPFVVETNQYDVRVLGTKFNVFSSPREKDFSVSVLEGRVLVSERRNPDNRIYLTSDTEVKTSTNRLARQPIADRDIFRWREGLLCFHDEPLGSLLERFRRNYDVNIIVRTDRLPDNVMSGKLRVSDGIFHALRVLQKDVPYTWQWDEKDNIIYIDNP